MVIRTLALAAAVTAAGSGCAGTSLWKERPKVPEGIPTAPLSPSVKPETGAVVQASAMSQAASAPSAISTTVAKITGSKQPRQLATSMTVMWRNKIDYLPDPSEGANGRMGPGLAGQMFLFGPTMLPVPADGKLVVALYDETPRPDGQPANKPEGWEFDKESLRKLVTMDERFGKSFALFLPWPSYRSDITKVRIAARYEPEQGDVLYAAETKITIDTTITAPGGFGGGAQVLDWSTGPAGAGSSQPSTSFSPLGGPPPLGGVQPSFSPLGGPPPAGAGGFGGSPMGAGTGFGNVPMPPPNFGTVPQAPSGAFPNAPQGGVPVTGTGTGMGMPANFGGPQGQPGQVGPAGQQGQGPPPGLPSLSMTVPPLTVR